MNFTLFLSLWRSRILCLLILLITSTSAKITASGHDIHDDDFLKTFMTGATTEENKTPIIGVLSQEVSRLILREYPGRNFTSYLAASYVKFIEGAGGRVVPIWIGQPRDYYIDLMSKINGVLLPGGATFFNQTHGYADAGKHIYEIAKDMNDRGIYFPVWGTCLGFELLVVLTANGTDPRTSCSSKNQALPLEFKDIYRKSRMFQNASDEVIDYMKRYPVTANFHIFCFTEEIFDTMKLNEMWRVMSVNHDWNGNEFISTIEHLRYPFYGVQFHPEKNLYEFVANRGIPHSKPALLTSQYFANFFLSETRKNANYFSNKTEEMNALIYNYQPVYTGPLGSVFAQQYLFEFHNAAPSAYLGLKMWTQVVLISTGLIALRLLLLPLRLY